MLTPASSFHGLGYRSRGYRAGSSLRSCGSILLTYKQAELQSLMKDPRTKMSRAPVDRSVARILLAAPAPRSHKIRGGGALGVLLAQPLEIAPEAVHLPAQKAPKSLPAPRRAARQGGKPLLHTRGISRARSFDLEVTPWAPTRLTSCISHPGPEESSGAPTLAQAAQMRPGAISPPRNRPASLCCTLAAFPGPEASTWR